MAFTTSGQQTEWAYSYSPGAHTGLLTSNHDVQNIHFYSALYGLQCKALYSP